VLPVPTPPPFAHSREPPQHRVLPTLVAQSWRYPGFLAYGTDEGTKGGNVPQREHKIAVRGILQAPHFRVVL
jgi:hypothetical protein